MNHINRIRHYFTVTYNGVKYDECFIDLKFNDDFRTAKITAYGVVMRNLDPPVCEKPKWLTKEIREKQIKRIAF